ncbi:DUF4038 domain-containing protein [Candidatus Poribacteria bacterium]
MGSEWQLKVSNDGRFLERADGAPWFWLGDTAWSLFIHLGRDDVKRYFEDRRDKGFTVIQAVVLMGYNVDFNAPNVYGYQPLIDDDPTKPDLTGHENFWTHADYIIDTAAEYGLYIGLLPTWGYHIAGSQKTSVMFTLESAGIYAEWIARRYKDRPNIIWINGGDIAGDEHGETDVEIWRAMGAKYKENCPDHLVTFHPNGHHSSATHFHDDDWLDFNMIQSGHAKLGNRNDEMIARDYQRDPAKPILDGEPRYEDHPVRWDPQKGFFFDYDVRQAAYFALFAGAFGHTYGHVNLWRFNVPGLVRTKERFDMMDLYWQDLLDSPGAWQMSYARQLMLSRPQKGRIPNQSLLSYNYDGERGLVATSGEGYIFVYTTYGHTVGIRQKEVPWQNSCSWWYDPRTGASSSCNGIQQGDSMLFQPPGDPYRGNDWVLVIDEKAKDYGCPGENP